MVLIVKKFVKVFDPSAKIPAKFKNLRKNKHVKTFLKPYPTIPKILVTEYGLDPKEAAVSVIFQWVKGVRVPVYPATIAEAEVQIPKR